MLTRDAMQGVYVLPPTPFKPEDGSLDEEALVHNIKALADAGVSAVVSTGTIGEFHTITWEDHQKVAKILARECKANGIVSVCGCSGVNTDEAIKKVSMAQAAGCDGIMNVCPFYIELTHAEVIKYWRDLGDACPNIGLIIYNNPQTSQLHDLEIYRGIHDLPNLCGAKEAHYNWGLWYELSWRYPDLGLFTSTEPEWVVPTLRLGARGIFSMAATMIPRYIVKVVELCKQGQFDTANRMMAKVEDMNRQLWGFEGMGDKYTGICGFKAMVNAFGVLRCGVNRRPFISVPQDMQDRLREFVHANFQEMINP